MIFCRAMTIGVLLVIAGCSALKGPTEAGPGDTANSLFQQSELSYRQGDLLAAERFAKEALALEPRNFSAQYRLGTILFKQNRMEEAAVRFLDAIKLNPRFDKAHYNLATIRLMQASEHFKYYTATTDPKADISAISKVLTDIEIFAEASRMAPSGAAVSQ